MIVIEICTKPYIKEFLEVSFGKTIEFKGTSLYEQLLLILQSEPGHNDNDEVLNKVSKFKTSKIKVMVPNSFKKDHGCIDNRVIYRFSQACESYFHETFIRFVSAQKTRGVSKIQAIRNFIDLYGISDKNRKSETFERYYTRNHKKIR